MMHAHAYSSYYASRPLLQAMIEASVPFRYGPSGPLMFVHCAQTFGAWGTAMFAVTEWRGRVRATDDASRKLTLTWTRTVRKSTDESDVLVSLPCSCLERRTCELP